MSSGKYRLNTVNVRLVKESTILSDYPIVSSESAVKLAAEEFKTYDREVVAVINLIYADNLLDADILIVPIEKEPTAEQHLDINTAINNNLKISILSTAKIMNEEFSPILDKVFDEKIKREERREINNLDDDLEYGLELRL